MTNCVKVDKHVLGDHITLSVAAQKLREWSSPGALYRLTAGYVDHGAPDTIPGESWESSCGFTAATADISKGIDWRDKDSSLQSRIRVP